MDKTLVLLTNTHAYPIIYEVKIVAWLIIGENSDGKLLTTFSFGSITQMYENINENIPFALIYAGDYEYIATEEAAYAADEIMPTTDRRYPTDAIEAAGSYEELAVGIEFQEATEMAGIY